MKTIMVGGGGHARSLLAINQNLFNTFCGYVAPQPTDGFPLPYLGTDSIIQPNLAATTKLVLGIGASGQGLPTDTDRQHALNLFNGFDFLTLIAQDAFCAKSAKIGCGCAVFHRAVVNADAILGKYCVINTAAVVEHNCTLHDNVMLSPGAIALGGCNIGDNVFIGSGAILREGTNICPNVVVGMGSLVVHDIVDPGFYWGTPAKRQRID